MNVRVARASKFRILSVRGPHVGNHTWKKGRIMNACGLDRLGSEAIIPQNKTTTTQRLGSQNGGPCKLRTLSFSSPAQQLRILIFGCPCVSVSKLGLPRRFRVESVGCPNHRKPVSQHTSSKNIEHHTHAGNSAAMLHYLTLWWCSRGVLYIRPPRPHLDFNKLVCSDVLHPKLPGPESLGCYASEPPSLGPQAWAQERGGT